MRARIRNFVFGTAALIAAGFAAGAMANDSSAELATGGLVLTKNPAIEMRSEDLYLSTKAVRVHYVFANTSAQDVTILVAFPMPDITTTGGDDTFVVPTDDPTNLLGFVTTVDGQRVNAQVEQKAIAKGVDQTAYLRSVGIPIQPHLDATDTAVSNAPRAIQVALTARGLATDDYFDDGTGHGMQHHMQPTWTLKTTFYWRQTFPAGKTITVEHNYIPSVGGAAETSYGDPAQAGNDYYKAGVARYCIDNSFFAAIAQGVAAGKAAVKPPHTGFYYSENRIDYVLTTGANWKAPIGDFHMIIDKGDAANLVSFCGSGVAKINPTQFEVHYTNFTPTKDVAILLLNPELF